MECKVLHLIAPAPSSTYMHVNLSKFVYVDLFPSWLAYNILCDLQGRLWIFCHLLCYVVQREKAQPLHVQSIYYNCHLQFPDTNTSIFLTFISYYNRTWNTELRKNLRTGSSRVLATSQSYHASCCKKSKIRNVQSRT